MDDHLEDLEKRLKFIHQVIPPDDLAEFIDLMLVMNYYLTNVLNEFCNLQTVIAVYPEVGRIIKNMIEFRLRMRNNDIRKISLEKFDLSN